MSAPDIGIGSDGSPCLGDGASPITWLHLSDLHLCEARNGWESRKALDSLLCDLRGLEEKGLVPDLVFVTGDCVFGDIPASPIYEQFTQVATLLDSIRTCYTREIPKSRVFIVPGNHDVNRNEVRDDQTYWLDCCAELSSIESLIHKANRQWSSYMERLQEYKDFVQDHGYSHLLQDPGRLTYGHNVEVNGINLGIVGMNSAWSCGRDQEKGRLWLGGMWQVEQALNVTASADVRIALIHHPPNWFVEFEDPDLDHHFAKSFDFLLHGHEHQCWVNRPNTAHVRIAAGACYDSRDRENGYNITRIDPQHASCEVWLRHYDSRGSGWIPRLVANFAEDGVWRLENMDCFRDCSPTSPKTPKPSWGIPEAATPAQTTSLNVEDLHIIKEIGRGSFGIVYHAKHTPTGSDVAVKVFSPQ